MHRRTARPKLRRGGDAGHRLRDAGEDFTFPSANAECTDDSAQLCSGLDDDIAWANVSAAWNRCISMQGSNPPPGYCAQCEAAFLAAGFPEEALEGVESQYPCDGFDRHDPYCEELDCACSASCNPGPPTTEPVEAEGMCPIGSEPLAPDSPLLGELSSACAQQGEDFTIDSQTIECEATGDDDPVDIPARRRGVRR